MTKREQNKYAAETIRELREIAAGCQARGDKGGQLAAERRIQQMLDGWS